MRLTLNDFRNVAAFSGTLNSTYITDLFLKQSELDGQLPCQVLEGLTAKMGATSDSFILTYPKHEKKIEKAIILSEIPSFLVAFFPDASLSKKIIQATQKLAPYAYLIDVINVIAFYQLNYTVMAVAYLTGLIFSQLQRRQLLPQKAHQLVRTLIICCPVYTLLIPKNTRWYLFKKTMAVINLSHRFVGMLSKYPMWYWLETPKAHSIDKNLVEDWVKEKRAPSGREFHLSFQPNSIHKIPDIFEKKLDDQLDKEKPSGICRRLTERMDQLGCDLAQFKGLRKLITGYETGRFIDQVPPSLDLFNKIANLCLRDLLRKDDEDFKSKIASLHETGMHCADRWVADMSDAFDLNIPFEDQIHEKFSIIRSEILNEEIDQMLEKSPRLEKLIGGKRNVHYYQLLHLALRKSFRTNLGEAALTSSLCSSYYLNTLRLVIYKWIMGWGFYLNKDEKYWVERLQELLAPKTVKDSLDQDRELREISRAALYDWINRVNDRYELMTEDGEMDPTFFDSYEVDGVTQYELNSTGLELVLLDLGILKPQAL